MTPFNCYVYFYYIEFLVEWSFTTRDSLKKLLKGNVYVIHKSWNNDFKGSFNDYDLSTADLTIQVLNENKFWNDDYQD